MSEAVTALSRPWELPFWKPVPGKRLIFFYLVAIHALAITGLILYITPSLPVIMATLAFTLLGGLGTTVCYHRSLSHGTVKLNPVIEHFFIFWTMFNGSGNPASWVAYHRHHHAKSDTEDDISSPKHGGFWWAHIRWLYQSAPADEKRWCPELTRGMYQFWSQAELGVILLALCAGIAFGWEGFFWIGAIRLVYSLHGQCFVNSLTHLGKEHDDTSQNVWWLGPLQLSAWGENWHRNHHVNPASARLGLRWYQVDIGWYFIWTLEKIGLAHRVLRPKAAE
jgi:stearoyl-CoA desaturase (delta-9 desaturase)